MKNIILLSLILLLLISASCNTTEPPPPDGEKPTLELKLEDVSCIEAWIELTATNLQHPATITLKQFNPTGDTVTQNIILSNADSLLFIDSLLPNQTYKILAAMQPYNNASSELSVTTMDTTSHDFTFETFTFGGTAGSSSLYDVAIINENNIWAVGEIYVADTSINGYTKYNAVHWDGQIWELKKIAGHGEYPRRTVFAFSENDVWFDGGIKWDGVSYTVHMSGWPLMPNGDGWQINKMWGSSSSDLYAVGNNGNIAHYNGQSWSKIESGTDLNINDIWGISDGNGGFNKYLAAYNAMLKLDANKNLSRIEAESGMHIFSIWGYTNQLIYVVGGENDALYKNYKWEIINDPLVNTLYRIKGQNYNDVFGISSLGIILHFNGYNWGSINVPVENIFLKLDVKGNVISTVGWQGEKAVITIIRRNN
ncbi:MAG: glucosyl transferase [Ignavibacterium sp.]|jgi:hypothetical protein|nr:glucosyl transferase [Ignavibacterium sp.]